MRRRAFITLIGGAAAAWPLAARAQQSERVRRIGVLTALSESDPEVMAWQKAFQEELQRLGWEQGRNVRIEHRSAGSDQHRLRTGAAELVGMTPDVLFANATPALVALNQEAPSFRVQLTRTDVRNAAEIERAINAFAQQPNGALLVAPNAVTIFHRDFIIALAAQHRLPAIYPYRFFAASGGFISYGVDLPYLYRQAASYVDRILKGAKPGDLPVQLASKFELVVNLKTAKALT